MGKDEDMPQAPSYLREMFEDDSKAFDVIDANFTDFKGVISPKVAGYQPTPKESNALAYLVMEWDYSVDMKGSLTE